MLSGGIGFEGHDGFHRNAAEAAGVNREELAEATFVAAALRAGAAFTYGAPRPRLRRATLGALFPSQSATTE